MERARIPVLVVALLTVVQASAGNDGTVEPLPSLPVSSERAAVAAEEDASGQAPVQSTEYPNVVVPHASEPGETSNVTQRASPRGVERDSDDVIELTDVGEVVAIPESARMIPADEQWDHTSVEGVKPDGWLDKRKVGACTALHVSKNRKFLFEGVDESVEIEGQATTRPILIVTTLVRKDVSRKRYPLAFKTVKPGQKGIEASMELRGGIKAVTEGVKPGTYDVYLEIALPGEDGKRVLACGTFAEEAIPALGEKKAGEAQAQR